LQSTNLKIRLNVLFDIKYMENQLNKIFKFKNKILPNLIILKENNLKNISKIHKLNISINMFNKKIEEKEFIEFQSLIIQLNEKFTKKTIKKFIKLTILINKKISNIFIDNNKNILLDIDNHQDRLNNVLL
jgi:hypothetical protein